MKKLNGWVRLGIVLSVAWLALASFAYVNEIINHPAYFAKNLQLDYFDFDWVEDTEGTEKAHAKAKAEGKDFSDRYVFLKPAFSPKGYFKLALLPLLVGWPGILLVIWGVRWVKEGFRT